MKLSRNQILNMIEQSDAVFVWCNIYVDSGSRTFAGQYRVTGRYFSVTRDEIYTAVKHTSDQYEYVADFNEDTSSLFIGPIGCPRVES
jgi:hypothetical protein